MDVGVLAGVGPRKLEGLRHLGITSLLDLLTHYPRRYIDRTREAQIRELSEGEEALVLGRVAAVSSRRVRGGRVIVVAELRDDSGSLRCTFFNQPWREKQLAKLDRQMAHARAAYARVNSWGVRSFYRCAVVDTAALDLATGELFARALAKLVE